MTAATAAPPRRKAREKKHAAASKALRTVPSPESQQIVDGAIRSAAADLQNHAVCLAIRFGLVGLQRKIDTDRAAKESVNDGAVFIAKVLYDAEELDDIKSIDGEVRRYVELKALPSLFKTGTYLLPNASVGEVERDLKDFAARRREAVDRFCAAYDRITAESKERLGDLADPEDFADAGAVRGAFSFRWHYVQYGVPGALADIDSELLANEQVKAARMWEDTLENARQVLRQGMASLLEHAVERLSDSGTGKKKVFRDTLLGNINDFLGSFDPRNKLTGDAELQKLAEQVRGIMSGVDPKTLRDDESARAAVRGGFAAVKQQLDTMLANKPARAISFDDV